MLLIINLTFMQYSIILIYITNMNTILSSKQYHLNTLYSIQHITLFADNSRTDTLPINMVFNVYPKKGLETVINVITSK